MVKKLLGLALCLLFLFSFMPSISLLAAEVKQAKPTSIKVGGTEVIAGGYWVTKDGKLTDGDKNNYNVRYDADKNELYLKNANVRGKDASSHGLQADGHITLILEGTNKFEPISTNDIEIKTHPKDSNASLTIDSTTSLAGVAFKCNNLVLTSGTLYVNTKTTLRQGVDSSGDITISGGSLTASGAFGADYSAGITTKGNITVTGGSVEGISLYSKSDGHGVFAQGNITVKGGHLKGSCEGSNNACYGVLAYGKICVSGGTLSGDGYINDPKFVPKFSYGVYSRDKIEVSGGLLEGGGDYAKEKSYGVFSQKGITVSGGELMGASADADSYSCGIYSSGDMDVSGGYVQGDAGSVQDVNFSSDGIYVEGGLTVSGVCDVMGSGGPHKGSVGDSYGVIAGAIKVDGGALIGNSEEAPKSLGVYSKSSISLSKGVITGTSGKGTGDFGVSCGVWADGDINVVSGELSGDGGEAKGKFGESFGVYAKNNVHVTTGMLTGTAGNSTFAYDVYTAFGKATTQGQGKIVGERFTEKHKGDKNTNTPGKNSLDNNVPQTGDAANLLPLLTLSVGSACMLAAVMLTLKKRKENN